MSTFIEAWGLEEPQVPVEKACHQPGGQQLVGSWRWVSKTCAETDKDRGECRPRALQTSLRGHMLRAWAGAGWRAWGSTWVYLKVWLLGSATPKACREVGGGVRGGQRLWRAGSGRGRGSIPLGPNMAAWQGWLQ